MARMKLGTLGTATTQGLDLHQDHIFGDLKAEQAKSSKVPNKYLPTSFWQIKSSKPGKEIIPWKESNNSEVESKLV